VLRHQLTSLNLHACCISMSASLLVQRMLFHTACMPCHNPTAQVQSYNYSNVGSGAEARAQLSAFVGSPACSPAPPSPLLVMAALPGGGHHAGAAG